jgi:HEAT repeat protein
MGRGASRIPLWQMLILVAGCAGVMMVVIDVLKSSDPIRPLVSRLRSTDVAIRLEALEEFEVLGPKAKAALPALLESLSDVDPRIRARSARVIAVLLGSDRNDPRIKDALPPVVMALGDPIPSVRHAAAIALALLDSAHPSVSPALIDALVDDDPAVRVAVVDSLGPYALTGDEEVFQAIFDRLKDRDPSVRAAVLRILGKPPLPDTFRSQISPAAVSALQEKSPEARRAAEGLLKTLAGDPAEGIPGLLAAMTDPSPEVRTRAIEASTAQKPRAVFPILIRATTDPDPRVRERACWHLGALDTFDPAMTLEALRVAMKDKDQAVREAAAGAAFAIERHAETRALALEQDLFELFDLVDNDPTIRSKAATRLGAYAPSTPEVIEALIRSLGDPDSTVVAASAHALGAIGPAAIKAIPSLTRLGTHDSDGVVRAANAAIAAIRAAKTP